MTFSSPAISLTCGSCSIPRCLNPLSLFTITNRLVCVCIGVCVCGGGEVVGRALFLKCFYFWMWSQGEIPLFKGNIWFLFADWSLVVICLLYATILLHVFSSIFSYWLCGMVHMNGTQVGRCILCLIVPMYYILVVEGEGVKNAVCALWELYNGCSA